MSVVEERNRALLVTRLVTPEQDGDWIPRTFNPGDLVYEFLGATYGCINWDVGIAVSEVAGENPFFEMPKDALMLEDVFG